MYIYIYVYIYVYKYILQYQPPRSRTLLDFGTYLEEKEIYSVEGVACEIAKGVR
jgi:hypothetical protein